MMDTKHLTETDVHDLFIAHYAKLVHYAAKFVSQEQAKDLVQDVFLQLLKKCGTLTIAGKLEHYVYKAIKNKYLDYVKSQNVHGKYVDQIHRLNVDELNYYDPSNHQSLLLNEDEAALFKALDSLPDKCREILISKFIYGKKTIQISEEFNISPRTVETHVYKGIKQLKLALRNVSMLFNFLL